MVKIDFLLYLFVFSGSNIDFLCLQSYSYQAQFMLKRVVLKVTRIVYISTIFFLIGTTISTQVQSALVWKSDILRPLRHSVVWSLSSRLEMHRYVQTHSIVCILNNSIQHPLVVVISLVYLIVGSHVVWVLCGSHSQRSWLFVMMVAPTLFNGSWELSILIFSLTYKSVMIPLIRQEFRGRVIA